jgi:DNA-binding CsgD family transcriptional regulator
MSPWHRLLRALRRLAQSIVFALRTYDLEVDLSDSLQALAERERRSEGEVAADLLSIALVQREMAEANLRRWEALTPREQQVTALICLNLTNQQIAERLYISSETVKTHIRNVLYKFNLHSKADLRHLLSDWDFSAWVDADLSGP